jgi:hypothetical protein
MIDMKKVIPHFLQEAESIYNSHHITDQQAIADLRSGNVGGIIRFMGNYYTLRGIAGANHVAIASALISFAKTLPFGGGPLSSSQVQNEFDRLYVAIESAAGATRSGNPRDVTSLTSKLLWLCYPKSVPIFDGHAKRALHVISKLDLTYAKNGIISGCLNPRPSLPTATAVCHTFAPPAGCNKYKIFSEIWFEVYDSPPVSTALAGFNPALCPYKVRVFDKILWLIGQPQYWP